jgi:pimeloyl-ACP methyl ester carboxylesterase
MPEAHATIVLVHGAWHGPWCWERLTPYLQAQSLAVVAVELPSLASPIPAGLPQDAEHLNQALKRIEGPVILCGHSYGGMVISAADTQQADVRHLVYLCAYMAEAGESVESSLRGAGERRPGHWLRRRPDGQTQVDAQRAASLFFNDCADEVQEWAVARLRPHWGQCLAQAVDHPAWRRHATTYVAGTADQVLSPRLQLGFYSARARHVVTLPSGHSPFLSCPARLAQLLASTTQ